MPAEIVKADSSEKENQSTCKREGGFLREREEMQGVPLAASANQRIELRRNGGAEERRLTETWNRWGGVLTEACRTVGVPIAAAIAVLCVESAGKGFSEDGQGRLTIRFECHVFHDRWGRKTRINEEEFGRHFQFQKEKRWLGHRFRAGEAETWKAVHKNQAREWEALGVARKLDDTGALYATSMGMAQILGLHFARLGFLSVQEMFEAFGDATLEMTTGERHGEREQLFGLFEFLRGGDGMIEALRTGDFVGFARIYNGPGKAEEYGGRIRRFYESCKRLMGKTPAA